MYIHGPRLSVKIIAPDLCQELVPCQDDPLVAHQFLQKFKFFEGERYLLSVHSDFMFFDVHADA